MNPKIIPTFSATGWILALLCSTCFLHAHPLDNWHDRYTNTTGLNGITFGNGLFVTVGSPGSILTSETGSSWASQISGTSQMLRRVVWGNGLFVAVGNGGTILSSPDGTNWTTRICPGISNTLWGVEFGQGRFVAIEFKNAATSVDGTNWIASSTGPVDGTAFTYGRGLFLVEANSKTNAASTDGINWYPLLSGSPTFLYTMAFAKGMFVAIDIHNNSFTSPDGTNWTQRGYVDLLRPSQMAYGSGHFVTVGGGNICYTKDAASWAVSTNGYLYVAWAVAYGKGTFVAVNGRIIQSDPVVWLDSIGPGSFYISGVPGSSCLIEATSTPHLSNSWQPVAMFPLIECPQSWTDPAPPTAGRRFYRTTMLP